VPAVLQRPHALSAERPAPPQQRAKASVTDGRGLVVEQLRCRRRERRHTVCERLCMSAASTIISRVLLGFVLDRQGGRPADTACCGRCHAPIKSRRPSRSATSDKAKGGQTPTGPTASKTVSSPSTGTISSPSDVTDSANHNSKLQSDSACRGRRGALRLIRH